MPVRSFASLSLFILVMVGGSLFLIGWSPGESADAPAPSLRTLSIPGAPLADPDQLDMVVIDAARFEMGHRLGGPDALPVHPITIGTFEMDRTEVTNAQFRKFVESTDYVTTAEQVGRSDVFDVEQQLWITLEGADWQHPAGPDSTVLGRDQLPVVHVSWFDAVAYARWAGKRLPTECEWEWAARGGLAADAPQLAEFLDGGAPPLANTWQGRFPYNNTAIDGFRGLAPVARFPANRYGLYDMIGNVHEWCADWYAEDYYHWSPNAHPTGPDTGRDRVLRGGSWLSDASVTRAATVWGRTHRDPSSTDNQTGFRCVR